MAQPIIQPSFAAGELSPSLYARVDLAKYHVGAARLLNFFVDYRGGASNRPGTQFIGQSKTTSSNAPRLIPFQFSTIQTYALEFGDLYMRVIKDGGYVLETAKNVTGATQANPCVITSASHGFSNGDWVYFLAVGGMTQLNGKSYIVANVTTNTFSLKDLFGNAIDSSAYTAYTSGGTVARYFTLTTPYAIADVPALKYTQSADVMTITHVSYQTRDLTRTGHAAWTLTAISFASTVSTPTNLALASTNTSVSANSPSYGYKITAINSSGEESLPCSPLTIAVDSAARSSIKLTWSVVSGAVSYNVYRSTQASYAYVGANDTPQTSLYGFICNCLGNQYVDSVPLGSPSTTADFSKTPPQHKDPFAVSAISAITITAGGTAYTSAAIITITDPTGTGASARPVVANGVVLGAVIDNGGSGYTSPTVSITGGGSGATATATIGSTTGTYPSAPAYFQQRKWLAASTNNPQTLWATKTGLFQNMDTANPIQSNDAITATLAAQQVNNVLAMVPMPGGLIILTGAGAWQISGGGQNQPVTPSNISAQAQAYTGCHSTILPIIINYNILYVQSKGSIVRDLAYNFYANIYTGTDITVLSNHFFFGYQLVEWAYAEQPYKLVWIVRDDGALLSLTYLKEQEIQGWAKHTTDGDFKSVCSISEGSENAVYFVIQRTINGNTVNYVERLASRNMSSDVENAWFVDAGVQYSGSPATVMTGLDHLEGETVTGVADGLVVTPTVVVNGSITLGTAASLVTLGLPFTAQLQTLYVDLGEPTIQGKRKKLNALTARVSDTIAGPDNGLQAGSTFSTLTPFRFDSSGAPLGNALFDGDLRTTLDPSWNPYGQICIEQQKPLPVSILGVIPEISVGDTK